MDLDALEYTRQHYNKHSNQFQSTQEALAARKQGPGAPLKTLHNKIKRELINRFASGADRLLDLACGRGGDIWKWIDAGIKHVKGVDLSPGEIEEARKRFKETRETLAKRAAAVAARGGGRPALDPADLDYTFIDTPALGLEEWKEPQQYDAVTCMFAIHYFFVSEASLKRFLANVSLNLKDGGYFIGTVPDGKRVNDCSYSRGRRGTYNSQMLRVEARWQGQPACFGSPYICAIGDTVTGSEKGTEGSLEYLVYGNVLVQLAGQYGLRPVLRYDCPALDELLEEDDRFKALKHFKPYFPGSHESLEEASRLFTTFVFQKTKGDPEPPPPREPSAQQQQQQAAAAGKRPREEDSGAAVPAEERTAGGDAGGQEGGPATKKAAQYKRPSVQRKPRTAQEPPGDAG